MLKKQYITIYSIPISFDKTINKGQKNQVPILTTYYVTNINVSLPIGRYLSVNVKLFNLFKKLN